MAYTIPEYVDTPEQAILAVASAVKDEQVTGGDGSVNTALDILADVLAGENIEVPQTNAGAILALAQYVGNMNGGSMYDGIIKLDSHDLNIVSAGTLVKGDYSAMQSKALAQEPVTFLVYGAENSAEEPYTTTFCVQEAHYETYVEEGEDPYFSLFVTKLNEAKKIYASSTSGGTNTMGVYVTSNGSSADTKNKVGRCVKICSDDTIEIV